MPDLSHTEIMDAAVAKTLQAKPWETIVTDPIPKNTWDQYKDTHSDVIEFITHKTLPGLEKSSGGTPNSGNLGRGQMKKRIIVPADD